EIYTLALHDALPIFAMLQGVPRVFVRVGSPHSDGDVPPETSDRLPIPYRADDREVPVLPRRPFPAVPEGIEDADPVEERHRYPPYSLGDRVDVPEQR